MRCAQLAADKQVEDALGLGATHEGVQFRHRYLYGPGLADIVKRAQPDQVAALVHRELKQSGCLVQLNL
jgi:hypothetical protein